MRQANWSETCLTNCSNLPEKVMYRGKTFCKRGLFDMVLVLYFKKNNPKNKPSLIFLNFFSSKNPEIWLLDCLVWGINCYKAKIFPFFVPIARKKAPFGGGKIEPLEIKGAFVVAEPLFLRGPNRGPPLTPEIFE